MLTFFFLIVNISFWSLGFPSRLLSLSLLSLSLSLSLSLLFPLLSISISLLWLPFLGGLLLWLPSLIKSSKFLIELSDSLASESLAYTPGIFLFIIWEILLLVSLSRRSKIGFFLGSLLLLSIWTFSSLWLSLRLSSLIKFCICKLLILLSLSSWLSSLLLLLLSLPSLLSSFRFLLVLLFMLLLSPLSPTFIASS